jgi:FAD/FMN-containing dehydrogenase
MVPVSRGIGSYVNAMSDSGVDERVRASYGAKYDRLAAIKATYDPDNLFHLNANIKPA